MDLKGACSIVLFVSTLFMVSDAFKQQHCSLCQPGWGLTRLCSPSRPTLCHLCPPKTYSPREPHLSKCTPCSKCGEGLYEEKRCTRFHDTKCDSCDTVNGKYNEDFITKCQKSNKIGHEKPDSLLDRVDDDFFDIDVFAPSEQKLSDEDFRIQDSDETFWNYVDADYDNSKPWSSESEQKESKARKNLADLAVIPNPNFRVNMNNPNLPDRKLADLFQSDPSVQNFQPIEIHNGIQRYTPLPLSPPKGANQESANRLPFLNRINGLQRYTPLSLDERIGGSINGLGRYTPLPLEDHKKGDQIVFNRLPDSFETFDDEARLHTQIDDGFGEFRARDSPRQSGHEKFRARDSPRQSGHEKFRARDSHRQSGHEEQAKLFDTPDNEDVAAVDVLEPLESTEDMHNAWEMKKILPFWPYFGVPPESQDKDLHHRFVENDGEKFVGHRLIRVKPSTHAIDMMNRLRSQRRRFYVLTGVSCAAFLATLIFLGIVLRRCWRSADTDWTSRYQQLQLQLSPSDNKIIKDCAAKFDTSATLDRLRRRPGDTDHQPLIQIQENPMALVHYLELSSSEESLP